MLSNKQGPPGTRLHCFILALATLVGGKSLLSAFGLPFVLKHSCLQPQLPTTSRLNCMAVILTNRTNESNSIAICLTKHTLLREYPVLLHLVHSHNIEMTCENQYKTFIYFSNHRIHPKATP